MRRIVEITKADGTKQYCCERQGWIIKSNWHTMTFPVDVGCELDAVFDTLNEAKRFLGIHDSQITQSEKVIWQDNLRCEDCNHHGTKQCPPSVKCYSLDNHPYYTPKK